MENSDFPDGSAGPVKAGTNLTEARIFQTPYDLPWPVRGPLGVESLQPGNALVQVLDLVAQIQIFSLQQFNFLVYRRYLRIELFTERAENPSSPVRAGAAVSSSRGTARANRERVFIAGSPSVS